jgi:hypothetical protein
MSSNLINKTAIRKFTKVLHARAAAALAEIDRPGVLQLCSMAPDDRGLCTQAFGVGDVDAMTKAAVINAEAGRNVYVEGRLRPGCARRSAARSAQRLECSHSLLIVTPTETRPGV